VKVRDLAHDGERINAPALPAMFRRIVADNRAGG
jgi:hypothetical protein